MHQTDPENDSTVSSSHTYLDVYSRAVLAAYASLIHPVVYYSINLFHTGDTYTLYYTADIVLNTILNACEVSLNTLRSKTKHKLQFKCNSNRSPRVIRQTQSWDKSS
jgi:hypothetical protein